jgi:5-methylcytosine-specific restriction endonuclease McrA
MRRVFSRSDLRRSVVASMPLIAHYDYHRPRVKAWCACPKCEQLVPRYLFVVDHINPVIPLDSSLEAMSWSDVVDRMWCHKKNLVAICKECHLAKTKCERKQRTIYKRIAKIK